MGARKFLIKNLTAEAKPLDRHAQRAGFSFRWKPSLTGRFLIFPAFVQRVLDLLAGHGRGNARLTVGPWHSKLLKNMALVDRHVVDRADAKGTVASKPFKRVVAGFVRTEKMRYCEILKANETKPGHCIGTSGTSGISGIGHCTTCAAKKPMSSCNEGFTCAASTKASCLSCRNWVHGMAAK